MGKLPDPEDECEFEFEIDDDEWDKFLDEAFKSMKEALDKDAPEEADDSYYAPSAPEDGAEDSPEDKQRSPLDLLKKLLS